jgi:hypothetical protein
MNLAEYDRFEHLRRALFWKSETVLMIVTAKPYTAYADDSGKKASDYLLVGGWIGLAGPLELLQKRWKEKVHKKGLPEFKRSKYNVRKHGTDFLHELISLIHQHTLYGFACAVANDDWKIVSKEYALELYHLVPYSICARTCIGLVREWCAKNGIQGDHMAYIFDKGSDGAGELIELLKIDQSADARKVISSVSSGDSEELSVLQASDFLAGELRDQFVKDPDATDLDAVSPVLKHLLAKPFDIDGTLMPKFGIYYAKDLRKLCKTAGVPLVSGVPKEIWNLPKPIRLKWPATKP